MSLVESLQVSVLWYAPRRIRLDDATCLGKEASSKSAIIELIIVEMNATQ